MTDPPVWRRTWRTGTKAADVRRFANHNPIFTRDEIDAHLGEDHRATLAALVRSLEIKRPAEGIYTAPGIDSTDPEVDLLVTLRSAKRTTPDRLARFSRRLAEKAALDHRRNGPKAPSARRLRGMRAPVFDRAEAEAYLEEVPDAAIARLVADRALGVVHPGLYRKAWATDHGPEVRKWATERSRRDAEVARSIDLSHAMHSVRDGHGPIEVTGFHLYPKRTRISKDRVYVNFSRLGSIYAVGGGRGGRAIWSSKTSRTGLTKEAAAFVAEELFGRNQPFGELMAALERHRIDPDKGRASPTMPRFRAKGPFDFERRQGERNGERDTRH